MGYADPQQGTIYLCPAIFKKQHSAKLPRLLYHESIHNVDFGEAGLSIPIIPGVKSRTIRRIGDMLYYNPETGEYYNKLRQRIDKHAIAKDYLFNSASIYDNMAWELYQKAK